MDNIPEEFEAWLSSATGVPFSEIGSDYIKDHLHTWQATKESSRKELEELQERVRKLINLGAEQRKELEEKDRRIAEYQMHFMRMHTLWVACGNEPIDFDTEELTKQLAAAREKDASTIAEQKRTIEEMRKVLEAAYEINLENKAHKRTIADMETREKMYVEEFKHIRILLAKLKQL